MYRVETEQEADGRWIAEVPELAGVLVYGTSREQAIRKGQALSLRVLAERLEHGEDLPQVENVFSIVSETSVGSLDASVCTANVLPPSSDFATISCSAAKSW